MAKPAAKVKKKIKRIVTDGIAHVHASFNNTIVTITDRQGLPFRATSRGFREPQVPRSPPEPLKASGALGLRVKTEVRIRVRVRV
jgi:hypothetical protein